jgi:hypothetical protein
MQYWQFSTRQNAQNHLSLSLGTLLAYVTMKWAANLMAQAKRVQPEANILTHAENMGQGCARKPAKEQFCTESREKGLRERKKVLQKSRKKDLRKSREKGLPGNVDGRPAEKKGFAGYLVGICRLTRRDLQVNSYQESRTWTSTPTKTARTCVAPRRARRESRKTGPAGKQEKGLAG